MKPTIVYCVCVTNRRRVSRTKFHFQNQYRNERRAANTFNGVELAHKVGASSKKINFCKLVLVSTFFRRILLCEQFTRRVRSNNKKKTEKRHKTLAKIEFSFDKFSRKFFGFFLRRGSVEITEREQIFCSKTEKIETWKISVFRHFCHKISIAEKHKSRYFF